MDAKGQLYNSKVRPKMAACSGNVADKEFADFLGKFCQLSVAQGFEVARFLDRFKQSHGFSLIAGPLPHPNICGRRALGFPVRIELRCR